jgi:hypothetical protein
MSQTWIGGVLELVGGTAILLGLFTRPVALLLSGEMAVAYFQFHQPNGFWPIQNHGEPAVLFSFIFLLFAAHGERLEPRWPMQGARKGRAERRGRRGHRRSTCGASGAPVAASGAVLLSESRRHAIVCAASVTTATLPTTRASLPEPCHPVCPRGSGIPDVPVESARPRSTRCVNGPNQPRTQGTDMKYLCLAYGDQRKMEALTKGEFEDLVARCKGHDEELRRTGHVVLTESLEWATATIRPRGGKSLVTDGPFVESKEKVGGLFILEARDLNEAIRLASLAPAAHLGEQLGWAIEAADLRRLPP